MGGVPDSVPDGVPDGVPGFHWAANIVYITCLELVCKCCKVVRNRAFILKFKKKVNQPFLKHS